MKYCGSNLFCGGGFIHSCNKYFLSTYSNPHLLSIFLLCQAGSGNTQENEKGKAPVFMELLFHGRERDDKHTKGIPTLGLFWCAVSSALRAFTLLVAWLAPSCHHSGHGFIYQETPFLSTLSRGGLLPPTTHPVSLISFFSGLIPATGV